jgi:hypothetical protein
MATYNRGATKRTLKDIESAILRAQIGTRAFSSGALAIGGTTTKVKIAAAIQFCIDNVNYVKAITDNLFVHTDLTVQAANTTRYYLLTLDASGNALITQGTATALPDCPADQCPVGYLKIVTTATFTPATTAHGAAGITTTYVNLSQMPLALV